jgi:hypothetical protein
MFSNIYVESALPVLAGVDLGLYSKKPDRLISSESIPSSSRVARYEGIILWRHFSALLIPNHYLLATWVGVVVEFDHTGYVVCHSPLS